MSDDTNTVSLPVTPASRTSLVQQAPDTVIPTGEAREDRLARLNEKAKRLTKDPGVYLMKDDKGRVIYVGKSASLRDRVGSYFQPSTVLEPRKRGLLDEVVDFDVLGCENEAEALLAENRLIKDIQPKYNARLMDDKSFPYLVITLNEDFPGVYVTRTPAEYGKRAKVYGPYTSVYALKESINHLQKAYKFRTCTLDIVEDESIDPSKDKRRFFRPCILYNIKQCTGPCAARISKADYREDIKRFMHVLESDRSQYVKRREKEMADASKSMNFELAAKIRDEIKALTALDKRANKGTETFWQPEIFSQAFVSDPAKGVEALQKALGSDTPPRVVECFDIAHLQGGEMVGSKVCFVDGKPFKDSYRRYRIKHGQGNNDFLSMQEVISRRYRDAGTGTELYPDLIVIDGGIGQLSSVMQVFRDMDHQPPMVISLAKKEELIYTVGSNEPIRLAKNNAGLKLLQYARDEAHRFAQHYHHILRRKAQLEEDVKAGKRPPKKIRKLRQKEVRSDRGIPGAG